jgi:hypothetical protein
MRKGGRGGVGGDGGSACSMLWAASYSGSARMSLSQAATRGYFEKSF